MAKERTINEIRQTKEYYTGNEHQKYAEKANKSEEMKQNRCPLDPIEEAKVLIVDKITKHFQDVMFEMVNEAMMEHKVFQSQNYLTEAGYEQFEDEWFEFYHEHHGDIIYEVMQNITN
jgi:hypoxanthine phosphoribosyltransferase